MTNPTGIKPDVIRSIERMHFSRDELTIVLASILSLESFIPQDELDDYLVLVKSTTSEFKRWMKKIDKKKDPRL